MAILALVAWGWPGAGAVFNSSTSSTSSFGLGLWPAGAMDWVGWSDLNQGAYDVVSERNAIRESTGSTWSLVSAGENHVCGIKTNGTLWCWRLNSYGEVGDGSTTQHTSPVQFGAAATWSSVNPGKQHTCGTRTDGTLWCWGRTARVSWPTARPASEPVHLRGALDRNRGVQRRRR